MEQDVTLNIHYSAPQEVWEKISEVYQSMPYWLGYDNGPHWGDGQNMEIATMTFRLHAPWVHSLKEKRMIVKSIIAKIQNKFHVSVSEIDEQDIHQIIVIGVAAIVPHNAMADSLMDEISSFVEENTEAEILDEMREIR